MKIEIFDDKTNITIKEYGSVEYENILKLMEEFKSDLIKNQISGGGKLYGDGMLLLMVCQSLWNELDELKQSKNDKIIAKLDSILSKENEITSLMQSYASDILRQTNRYT